MTKSCLTALLFALILLVRNALADDAAAKSNEPVTQYQAGPGAIPQTITSPLGKPMKLKWNDEFDAVTDTDGQPYIDRSKWMTTFWQGSSQRTLLGNGETQYYMDKDYAGKNNIAVDQRPNPFSFETPGILTISASKTPEALWGNYWMGQGRCITSGLLVSDRHFTFKYGYVEGRFKIPMERGSWPAFWMLGDTLPADQQAQITNQLTPGQIKAHQWPPEIDILESLGIWKTKFDTGYIAPKGEKIKVSQWLHDTGTNLSDDFHTWGMEWDENNIVWTFDGKIIAHGNVTESFRRPFYLLVNLAVGGNWYSQEMKKRGTPYTYWQVDWDSMPWKMQCDYVRVYQADDGTPPSAPFGGGAQSGAGHYDLNGTAPQ